MRALTAAGVAGLLVILFGEMSVPDIGAKALGTSGLPYLIHHIPVLSATGQVLGVADDGALVAAEGRTPLLRRAIARAQSPALFARSLDSWHRAARSLAEDPTQEKGLILVSVLADSRPVWSSSGVIGGGLWDARPYPEHPELLRMLARFALSFRPPTGFLRDFVVEHSGERRGQLDLKHGGMIPIVDLARWAGIAAGVASAPTPDRLRAAAAARTLKDAEASALAEAFGFISGLRLDHQIGLLRHGEPPDDFIDPKTLNPPGPVLPAGGVPGGGSVQGESGRRAVAWSPLELSFRLEGCRSGRGHFSGAALP